MVLLKNSFSQRYSNSTFIYFLKFNIVIEGKERPAKAKLFPAKLRENEFFSETILDCLSETQMGSIHEKNAKHLVTLPL